MKKRLIILFLLLSLTLNLSSCVTTRTIYKDVPEDSVVIKRETLNLLIETLINTKMELKECLERERIIQ